MDKLQSIRECTACDLHKNQPPTVDIRNSADVFWLGISSKIGISAPLDKTTLSGSLVADVEAQMPDVDFYSTNLVKCAPLNSAGKLRYPSSAEVHACSANFTTELEALDPRIVFLLGGIVAKKVLGNLGIKPEGLDSEFKYKTFEYEGITYVPIHHPSYIARFKRGEIQDYKDAAIRLIKEVLQI